MTFKLKIPASRDQPPAQYTADGEDLLPPFGWSDPPAGANSFALIVGDPGAPSATFRHWLLYNIMADRNFLSKGNRPRTENRISRHASSAPSMPVADICKIAARCTIKKTELVGTSAR